MPVRIVSPRARIVARWSSAILLTAGVLSVSTPAQKADAEAHKAWMNDASDAQEDFRFAVEEKDGKAAVEALAKLDRLMASTEAYWADRQAADGVKLAKDSRAQAQQAGIAAKAGDLAKAKDSFDAMGATCNACHELHLEKR